MNKLAGVGLTLAVAFGASAAVIDEAEARGKRGGYNRSFGKAPKRARGGGGVAYAALSGFTSFPNCAAARAAGAAPVRAGSPGYSRKLDRDGDGIGCE